ncbi:MAG: glycogen/starch synthase [Patescibacteria group bacterium]|nr:glycogen/starch synthase [Patescibacteria group bacterium]
MKKSKILLTAAELTPMAKVGGLADVIGALPKNLIRNHVDTRIIIPKYGIIDEKEYNLKKIASDIKVPFGNKEELINIWQSHLPGSAVLVYFIDNQKYLGRNGVYFEKDASPGGSSPECQRFTFFSRSIFETFKPLNFHPEVIHLHDWHVGIIPFLKNYLGQKNPSIRKIKTLLTIHNLAYQGNYNYREVLDYLNIKKEEAKNMKFMPLDKNNIKYLRQAILHADSLNTVSPTYAQEIMNAEYGAGLEKELQKRKEDLHGILNGIDVERFNPALDQEIIKQYSIDRLENKKINKKNLQKISGLKQSEDTPVLGLVGRLAEQKGIDLILQILPKLAKNNCQLVLLGTGNKELEENLKKAAKKYKNWLSATIDFDASLAQKIYAGSDMFLMPSRYEPCGLGQMIAMRYGNIPIVRATGGLADTVHEFNPENEVGTGFCFEKFEASEFYKATKRALEVYKNKEKWLKLMKNGMKKDFSWNKSAKKYIELYHQLI